MNYQLNTNEEKGQSRAGWGESVAKIKKILSGEKKYLVTAFVTILFTSAITLISPLLLARAIDKYLPIGDYSRILLTALVLIVLFLSNAAISYAQTRLVGGVGQRVLYKVRNRIFGQLQDLPLNFFNQNKIGDLISRINNDTDNLNQFFSQSLVQFAGNLVQIIGSGAFIVYLNPRLGVMALLPAFLVLVFTKLISAWVKSKNLGSTQALGTMSAQIKEGLANFKAIIVFDRRDYFREKFAEVNQLNYNKGIRAGLANNIFMPVYTFASQLGQLVVLLYGLYLISVGNFTIGLLVSYFAYLNNFYNPLRQLASLWANFEQALASWDRIGEILALQNDLTVIESEKVMTNDHKFVLSFENVSFRYTENGEDVLRNVNLHLERGRTYALVGPTGGGKSTTASLAARLYDPSAGKIALDGKDIRSYDPQERTNKIGFILQEPILFSGTVGENICYGNERYTDFDKEKLLADIKERKLEDLLSRFDNGLDTVVELSHDTMSLGQKQLVAFVRAVLREPEVLILDEATANIDTVTEKLLMQIIDALPSSTTKVIIAHRLNTIADADVIYFVNSGEIVEAGSMDHAVDMLLNHQNRS